MLLKKMKKMKNKKRIVPILAMVIMCIVFAIIVRKSGEPLSVDTILRYTPQNKICAVGILLVFFALKSLTVVFPLSILYIASGILFQPIIAVLVSTAGFVITITIPYWIGRYSGKRTIQEICKKYPKAGQVAEYQEQNVSFACSITRIVGFLPCDIVSVYFGACGTAYSMFLLAGIAGSLLSIVTTTLLGEKISDPFSIEFLIVLLCRIAVSISAVVINYQLNKKKK